MKLDRQIQYWSSLINESEDISTDEGLDIDSHSQRIGEADDIKTNSMVWRVTIKNKHGIYSDLLEDGQTKQDAIQNANEFLKKLDVDAVAVDAEPHENFYP